ncbi:MAG: gliding motility-associated C-terminal domain-containing protein [Cyclobacteriaceae bacterium]|nr:MAG: gliding motility-associated C-terminal domain-containing protein [Cyclobacteriaceae bacterium]
MEPKYLRNLLLTLAIFVVAPVMAQEICNNGIDDDGDGFVDCYDNECANSVVCEDLFIGNDADCVIPAPPAPAFTMTLDFASEDETANHLSRIAIGDLDRDGIPEIISMNRYTKRIFILNGDDGSIKHQALLENNATPNWEVAIANVDDDNCGEIFFLGTDSRIYAYDCQLNFLWRTNRMPGDHDPINFGLADFDGDGLVELYCKDQIFDAHSGRRLVATTVPNNQWDDRLNGGPVAVDILGDTRLELVLGLRIYQVNIPAARNTDGGSLTLLQSRNEYFVRNQYNATSVADFNQDGHLDVVASGSTIGHNQNTTIFFWDVFNNTLQTYRDLTGDYAPNGWGQGTGRVNIADLDGDGNLNLSYVSGKYLYALREDMTLLWRVVINEETSGHTGCTLFDFNGDGQSEIVYRDEQYLYIIDGTDGSIFTSQRCISRTNREYPIVADVDADGSTEICVTCGFDDVEAWDNFNTLSYSQYAHIRVFKSASEPWVPARRLWNQHGYFVVNVNDDLSIPRQIQKHHLVFSTGTCTQGPNRPLNKFLNQSPFLDSQGCPQFAGPNITFGTTDPVISAPTCPDLNFTVSFDITNLGNVSISGDIPISFYSSNPLLPGATLLNTITVNLNLEVNDTYAIVDAPITGIGSDSLYIVLNDNGTTIPTPITLPNTPYIECDPSDNIFGVRLNYLPAPLTAVEVNPNETCSAPANGAARAFVPVGGIENTADYDFYWFDGTTAGPIASADFVGPFYTGIPGGDYTVFARHKTVSCGSDTTQVTINDAITILPAVTITVVSDQTQCNPPNGRLEANVAGGNAGYSFEWEDVGAPIGVSGPILANQAAGTYTVVVTSSGGCQITASANIADLAQEPDLTANATGVINCNDPNSGSVTAEALIGGVAQPAANFTFNWYFYDNGTSTRGSLLPPVHGAAGTPNRNLLPVGFYEVEVTEIASGCPGTTTEIVEVTDDTQLPTVLFTELAPQTSCDPNNPNGSVSADAQLGGVTQDPAEYTFEWFVGQNTLPANAHTDVSGVNNRIAENLSSGGQSYTVRITNIATQCFTTAHTTVSEDIVVPIVTLSPTDNGICDPALSTNNFNGSVIASVTFDGVPVADFTDYTFTWYNGSVASGAPRAETGSSITQVNSGYYTVVVTRNDVSCSSTPETAEVGNDAVLPVITTAEIGSTNCTGPANGEASVTDVDGVGTPANYTYQWHTGNDLSSPIGGAINSTVTGLQGGAGAFFTVQVTNTNNGCRNTATIEVPDEKEFPIITLSSTPNTICTGTPDGTTSLATLTYQGAAVASPFTGYTFNWSSGQTTSTATALAAGAYTLTVTKTDVGCTSDPVNVDVANDFYIPVISLTPTNQTSCDPGNPNGVIAATIDETSIGGGAVVTAGYTFTWEENGNPFTTPGNAAGTGATVNNLVGDLFYSVVVTRSATGCVNTASVFLPETITNPIVAAAVSSDVTRCDTPNGAIQANVGGNQNGFTFFWLNETGTNQTADNALVIANADATIVDDGNYTGLIPGYYTVVARDNNTSCLSQPITRTVIDATVLSTITVTLGPTFPASCAANNGQMSATVSGGVGPFDLFWHVGGPSNSDINFFNNPPQFTPPNDVPFQTDLSTTSSNLNNLESRLYTLVVRDVGNGCGNYETVFLPFNDGHDINTNITPATNCTAVNGEVEVTVTNIIPATNDFQDYTYILYSGENPDPVNQIGPVLGPGGAVTNPVVYSSLAPGKYTVEVRQDLGAFGSNCPVYEVIEIEQHAFSPLVDITGTIANTACDLVAGADGEASIQFDIDPNDQTTNITYTVDINPAPLGWGGPTPVGPFLPPALPGNFTITGLSPDNAVPQYTITVTANGCSAQRLVSIPNAPAIPQVLNSEVTILPALYCDPALEINASVEVRNVINDGAPDNLNDYTFEWFDDAGLTSSILNAAGNATATKGGEILSNVGAPLPSVNITAAPYWVVATKVNAGTTGGLGCVSAPFMAVVPDQSVNPTITLTPFANTACDANFEGSLRVNVTNAGSVPSATYTYNFNVANPDGGGVFAGNDGDGLGIDGDRDNPQTLEEGVYQLLAINDASGCQASAQATIIKTSTPIIVASATPVDQSICTPLNGSITVVDVTVGGIVDPVHTNFDFTWYENDPNSVPIINAVNGADALTNIGAGVYFVKARKIAGLPVGSGCESAPLRVDIEDISEDPDLEFTMITPTSSCNPADPNGIILAEASERDGSTDAYTFAWTLNGGALHPATVQNDASPTSQLSSATFGDYELTITNTVTGCVFTSGATLIENLSLSLPNIVQVTPINPTDCFPTGSASVTQITIGGTTTLTAPPDDIDTNFDYEWYSGSTTPADLIAGETNSSLLNQLPNTYFVLVRDLTTDCPSTFVEVLIDSADIVYPVVAIAETVPQISCDPAVGTGTLVATGDGQTDSNPNYSFTWFPSLDLSGASFANTSTINNVVSGDYSVEVLNSLTNCRASALMIVANDSASFKPILSLTSGPLTECDSLDGFIFARGVPFAPAAGYPFSPYNYTAQLYVGQNPVLSNPPDFIMPLDPNPFGLPSFLQPNLSPDTYTVRLIDNNTSCETVDIIVLEDERVFPTPVIQTIAPVTNCDPTIPNGVGRVSVDGVVVGYNFDWYEGNVVAGTPVYTGVEYGQLRPIPQEYIVEARNMVTGCVGTVIATIANNPVGIPIPQIEILSHVTSCVMDNGALAASVNGNTRDYIFDWYGGTQETPPADFVGEIYRDLAVGPYSVTATDKVTGCKSPLATETIESRPALPEIDFRTQSATCGLSNGFATILIVSEVPIGTIEWFDSNNAPIVVGPNLTEVLPGTYTVVVTTELGCAASREIPIETEIRPFNGISRFSSPGQNDYFHIDCIDNFPNNIVKIFNRAGTLVYEGERYDNATTIFDGKSNKGISIMGTDLPDGTYFYIIDKRDGSKPLSGYLEIVN